MSSTELRGARAAATTESAPRTESVPALGSPSRGVLPVMIALMMSMFVSMLATTVVGSSLPVIIADLGGDQSAFTWVVTATLLATTVSTPVWGKIADLANRKLLLMLALTIFVVSTAIAGMSGSVTMLITMRVFQGLGGGGLAALSQIVMADVVSPRERGRYAGLFGAAMAVGTVGGPLLGGFLTDAISWRWNFYVGVPFAVIALYLVQRNLHLPKRINRSTTIDYLGIVLISSGVALLLLWVTFAGSSFAWSSVPSYVMAGAAVLLLVVAVLWELRVSDPLLPLTLFRNRTFTLSVVASLSTGVAMFGASVFLSQYMQLARGATPMQAGIMTIPMMAGLLVASTVIGNLVSRFGRWKGFVVSGAIAMIIGNVLLWQVHYDTPYWQLAIGMAILGAGVGMLMQNLVVVTQNTVPANRLGVATSAVTFFRSLGGTVGVSVMGTILGSVVASELKTSLAQLPPAAQAAAAEALGTGALPKIADLPEAVRPVVESAYGIGTGQVFLAAVPMAVITLLAVIFLPNIRLGTQTGIERHVAEAGAPAVAGPADSVAAAQRATAPDASARHAVAPDDAPTHAVHDDRPGVLEEVEDLAIEAGAAVGALLPVGSSQPGDLGPSGDEPAAGEAARPAHVSTERPSTREQG